VKQVPYKLAFSRVFEGGHELEIHVQLPMAKEERLAGMIGNELEFDRLGGDAQGVVRLLNRLAKRLYCARNRGR
jgi:hypothetical protein